MGDGSRIERIVGLDIGDKWTQVYEISRETGARLEEGRMRTTPSAVKKRFAGRARMRIALEVGGHSPWMSRLLKRLGHEVLVANASRVALIYKHSRKNDRVDAKTLARLARLDPELLHPIRHRSAAAQADLAVLKSREVLLESRKKCINHVRGTVKAFGGRVPNCSVEAFAKKAAEHIPEPLSASLEPLLEAIDSFTRRIRAYDQRIRQLLTKYPETELLRQVPGVGPITSLAYVLVIEDKGRFVKSRGAGAFLGLVPRMDSSGDSNPQLRITKEGNELLRRLLVNCAQYILGPFGPDCDLKRYGERIAQRGGKIAKKKAVIAVARKLAVLLHHLWITAEVYEPLFQTQRQENQAA